MLQMIETVLVTDALKYHLCIDWDIQVLFRVLAYTHISFLWKTLIYSPQNKANLETG